MCFFSTWRSSRPRRRMRGRSGTRRTPHAKGQNVALALAPRTCFLKVLLPLKRGAHFSLTNSSGAWGPSAASWGLLRIPGAFLGPPGTFCGLLGPPRAFAGMGRGAHPARRGKMSLSLLRRAHVFRKLRQHCFLCCGRAGGNGHAMHVSLELASLTPTPILIPY